MPNFFKNIKEPVSTFLGVLIILASVITVFLHIANWTEAGVGVAAGTALLFMKDKYGGDSIKFFVYALVLVSSLHYGCTRPAPRAPQIVYLQNSDSTSRELNITKDTTIIPADSVQLKVPRKEVDSAFASNLKTGKRQYLRVATKGNAKAKAFVEEGSLFIEGTCDSIQLVNIKLTETINRLRTKSVPIYSAEATQRDNVKLLFAFFIGLFLGIVISVKWLR